MNLSVHPPLSLVRAFTLLLFGVFSGFSATFTELVKFNEGTAANKPVLIQAKDGNFYGTIGQPPFGERQGVVFRMTPNGEFTILVRFNGVNGANPYTLIQADDGNFYGTTSLGGNYSCNNGNGCGTIFKMTPSGVLTTLVSFGSTVLVQGRDGNLYASGEGGGLIRITPTGSVTTFVPAPFVGPGWYSSLIIGNDGNFYGTTWTGGLYTNGSVYKVTPDGTLTTMASFDGTNGYRPLSLIQARDDNFYGITSYSNIFKLSPSGTISILTNSTISGSGFVAVTLLVGDDGYLYGSSYVFPPYPNQAQFFKVSPNGIFTQLGVIDDTNIHSFVATLSFCGLKPASKLRVKTSHSEVVEFITFLFFRSSGIGCQLK